ncbi:MAG: YheU family protein [Steroidobacteraceae bacterium]
MSETDVPAQEALEIPPEALSSEALRGVIESFVLREGTEYGAREYSLEEKCAQVLAQLKRGEARILYDPHTETVTLEPTAGRAYSRPG